jgi:hypothetical protein
LRGPAAEREWNLVAAAIEVDPDRLFRPRQVHGRAVVAVSATDASHAFSLGIRPEADAVITDDPSCAVAVQVADCVPILIADRQTRAVAAVHAGWRGAAAGVVQSAIDALGVHCGSRPGDLVVALGPSVGPCCYEVGPAVVDAFRAAGHDASSVDRWFAEGVDGRYRLDLWAAAGDQLRGAGVQVQAIHAVRLCTAHDTARFYSYRAEGAGTGRMAAVIRARG